MWCSNNLFEINAFHPDDLRTYNSGNETKKSNVYDPTFSRFRLDNSMERHLMCELCFLCTNSYSCAYLSRKYCRKTFFMVKFMDILFVHTKVTVGTFFSLRHLFPVTLDLYVKI